MSVNVAVVLSTTNWAIPYECRNFLNQHFGEEFEKYGTHEALSRQQSDNWSTDPWYAGGATLYLSDRLVIVPALSCPGSLRVNTAEITAAITASFSMTRRNVDSINYIVPYPSAVQLYWSVMKQCFDSLAVRDVTYLPCF